MPPETSSAVPTRAEARAACAVDRDGFAAIEAALQDISPLPSGVPDAIVLFASAEFGEQLPDLIQHAQRETGAPILLGCSATGVIGPREEQEDTPAIALLALSLPGARLWPVRITEEIVERSNAPEDWHQRLAAPPDEVRGWIVFADPFLINSETLVARLGAAYPRTPIVGGLASPRAGDRKSWVFLNGEVYASGAVGLGIGGAYDLVTLVSQGCEPIGEPWTITGAQDHWIESIGNWRAAEVLIQTLHALPKEMQARARQNVLVGLAIDEYRSEFKRGDFLIRNLIGIDRGTGALAVGTLTRPGQTIQFQMRDAATADLDLNLMLDALRTRLGDDEPIAGVLCSCTGRGTGLFGVPHHDITTISRKLGPLPIAGLFCAGEIGPVGDKPFVHGFTASLGLIVRATADGDSQS